jgi:hypothetical protein
MKKASLIAICMLLAMSLAACGGQGGGQGGGASAPDDQLSLLGWDGQAVEFSFYEEVTLTGISVYASDSEFAGKYVSNSEGNMGFANGTTLTPGSMVGFHGGLIIFAGTIASCEIDTGGVTPDKVCFYLDDGTTITRPL